MNDPVSTLLSMMKLGDSFRFYILVGDDPGLAGALARFEEELAVVRLAPTRPNPSREPGWHLIQGVLARLVFARMGESTPETLFVIDASRVTPATEDDWIMLFQRMNERRNVIAERMCGPLLLIGPPTIEVLFAKWAPDFWSIRSRALVLDAS
jgi:hypothetical protein